MGEAYQLLEGIRKRYDPLSKELEELKNGIKHNNKKLGILTEKVEENIDHLANGVIEIGQQPMALGGPSLLLNKIAYAKRLSELGDDGYTPLFYVADYDGVHAELLNIRVPSPSKSGLLISYPAPEEYYGAPIFELPNPSEDWFWDNLEKIAGNYRGLTKEMEDRKRDRIEWNLEHCFIIIKNAYYSTENVRDFSTKILGTLVNIEENLGIPFLNSCNPEIRRLFLRGYEFLLSKPNRTRFIYASNKAAEEIKSAGYKPQIGYRGEDYVPFFLECMNPDCHRYRVELKYKSLGKKAQIHGRCQRCEEKYVFSFDAEDPDLFEIRDWISPRVDSRQVIVDSIVPVLAHVGGPGETSYYAEVIPGVAPLNIPFPVYLRYTRTWYNTPWNESMASRLESLDLPVVVSEDLFKALSLWVEARNEDDANQLWEAHSRIQDSIMNVYKELLSKKDNLEKQIEYIKSTLSKPEGRNEQLKEMREKQHMLRLIEKYLSSSFGRFAPERFGQEVSWSWIDAAAVAGVHDVLGIYLREYNRNTPNASMFFVNL